MKQVLAALFVLAANLLNAQPLSERLDAWVRSDALKMSETGVTVFDLTEGKLLYAYQDEKLFRPASVEKIITSVTALARLGENFRTIRNSVIPERFGRTPCMEVCSWWAASIRYFRTKI